MSSSPTKTLSTTHFFKLPWLAWLSSIFLGWLVALFVNTDGVFGRRWQISQLGPNPSLVNDVPFFYTILLCVVATLLIALIIFALKSGSIDRIALGLVAFSFNADVIPGVFQAGLLSLLVLLVYRGIRQGNIPFRLTPMIVFIGLIYISYCTSFLFADKPMSLLGNLNFRTTYMFIMILLPAILVTRRHLEIYFDFLLVAALISVGVEVLQFVLTTVTGEIVTFSTSNYNRVSTPYGIFPRLTGLMYHPNHQSNLLASQAMMALWFATQPKELCARSRRWFYFVCYVVLAFGTVITWSRSGWLSIAVATAIVPILRWPKIAPWYVLSVLVIGSLGYFSGVAQGVYQIIHDFNGSSADFRWHIDDIAMDAFFNNPWFGVGVNLFIDYSNPYQLEVHDTYLQVASSMGLFGVLAVGGFAWTIVGRLIHVWARPAERHHREWAIALLLALLITSIQANFAMFLWVKFLWGMFGLSEALVLNNRDVKQHRVPEDFIFLSPRR